MVCKACQLRVVLVFDCDFFLIEFVYTSLSDADAVSPVLNPFWVYRRGSKEHETRIKVAQWSIDLVIKTNRNPIIPLLLRVLNNPKKYNRERPKTRMKLLVQLRVGVVQRRIKRWLNRVEPEHQAYHRVVRIEVIFLRQRLVRILNASQKEDVLEHLFTVQLHHVLQSLLGVPLHSLFQDADEEGLQADYDLVGCRLAELVLGPPFEAEGADLVLESPFLQFCDVEYLPIIFPGPGSALPIIIF